MSPRVRRLVPQLVVVVPTVLASLALGARGVPPLRRLITSGSLGLILIAIMTVWRLTQGPRAERQ
jgi:hypothetical protein